MTLDQSTDFRLQSFESPVVIDEKLLHDLFPGIFFFIQKHDICFLPAFQSVKDFLIYP